MEVKQYRAASLQEALRRVRQELGPQAAVLQTREVPQGLWGWLGSRREVEVTAALDVNVPARFPEAPSSARAAETAKGNRLLDGAEATHPQPAHSNLVVYREGDHAESLPAAEEFDYRSQFREDLKDQLAGLRSMVEELCRQPSAARNRELPEVLFTLFTELVDAEASEEIARELVERLRITSSEAELDDALLAKARLIRLLEDAIDCCGPLKVTPGCRRLVALVGPTGVGKTTTIAKLAAQFHLRQRARVGLVTVDTYRIAAVDQLRTYAEIIDLPMEVVTTPREMRAALARLADLDLVLMDTAGRSPRDELKLQELKSVLEEAQADEIHLVLSAGASAASLQRAAQRFAQVGISALIITKLDEVAGLGGILPLLRRSGLPLSYVSHGQDVPHDLSPADRRKLARAVLGMEPNP